MLIRSPCPNAPRSRGMTLIEVLVAMVVISVGLLGIAALQMLSLRNSQGAYLRTQATALAGDIIDRMRANRTVALAGGYDIAFGQTIVLGATPTIADHDRMEWKDALVAELPGIPDGKILSQGKLVTISIRWGERATDLEDAQDLVFTTSTEI